MGNKDKQWCVTVFCDRWGNILQLFTADWSKCQALHLKRQLHTTLVEAVDLQPHGSSSRHAPKGYTPRGRRNYINGLGILKKFEQEK